MNQAQYHHSCHSNLIRSLAQKTGLSKAEIETDVHDVLNVFMCTGFLQNTHQYFMKASPVRPGDYLEFFAEVNLLGPSLLALEVIVVASIPVTRLPVILCEWSTIDPPLTNKKPVGTHHPSIGITAPRNEIIKNYSSRGQIVCGLHLLWM